MYNYGHATNKPVIFATKFCILTAPSVAIVILNYNGKNYLQRFLPSVLASTYTNYSVVVADNASTDGSVAYVTEYFPQIVVLQNTQNDGFAGGYNWALKQVEAEYYVLLNSDVAVTAGWIEPIIALMQSNKSIAACQPKLLKHGDESYFEYAGAAGGWIDILGYPFSRGRIFDFLEKDSLQYQTNEKIFWASGAAMFVRSKVYHELNGFDATFFAHMEEIDLCWRMQLAGYEIMACPQSVVYHVGAGTLPRGGRKVFLNFRNNLLMLGKNLCMVEKMWKIPVRFALDAISAWKGLLQGDRDFFVAIMQAHAAVLYIWLKRSNTKHKLCRKPMIQLDGVAGKSLVWAHFINGKKKFSEIFEN